MKTPSGIPGFDQLLGGGLPQGRVCLIVGNSGAGKTTLGMQFLLEGARRGERTLYLGTAETDAELDQIAKSHGWDLSGVEIRHHDESETIGFEPEQTVLYPKEVQLPRLMDQFLAQIDEVKPDRLVIDSLSEIRILAGNTAWFRDQVKILKRHIDKSGCTVIVTDFADATGKDHDALRSRVHGIVELRQQHRSFGPDVRQVRVAKMRGVEHRTGFHDFTIESGGLRIFPKLVAAEHRERSSSGVCSTGIEPLDDLLGGGLDKGSSVLFAGPSGTGKSSLVTQAVVAAARRGEKGAIFLFDERSSVLLKRAETLNMELEELVDKGLVQLRQVDPLELSAGRFSQLVLDAVDDGVEMIAIDTLNGYSYAMPEERLLGLHLHELLAILGHKQVVSLLVMTLTSKYSPLSSPFDVSYIADTVINLHSFEFRGCVRKAITVNKRRGGSHETTVRELSLHTGQITIGEPLHDFSGVLSGTLQYLGDSLSAPKDST